MGSSPLLANQPRGDEVLPAALAPLAAGAAVRPVWVNELGGLTFELDWGDRRAFAKWAPIGSGADLSAEAVRLRWAVRYTRVPKLLEVGADESGQWILTASLEAESAASERYLAEPAVAVRAIGEGLRALHEALPVQACAFDWSAERRLEYVRTLAAAGRLDPSAWHTTHRDLGLERALALAETVPTPDHLVVCHGDACAPNTLLDTAGRFAGHVDLGSLGVADRWADLAVATWSTTWNYGTGWELPLLDAYGVAPDSERIAYYRLLWDLAP